MCYNFRTFISLMTVLFICPIQALAEIPRISNNHTDLSKVEKINLSPGLVTLLEFPQNIIEVRVGDPKSVKAIISPVSPKELTIYLSSGSSQASNLIVRAEKRIFVFDIVPSKSNHQDYYKISGSYGAPGFQSDSYKPIAKIPLTPLEPKANHHSANAKSESVRLEP